jgi:glycosyltransferase involved in cell wall biosynthesis
MEMPKLHARFALSFPKKPGGATWGNKPFLTAEGKRPAVIIVGPPWPRGGTARVIQNQVDYYRARGYLTVFVCVPIHSSYIETNPVWDDIKEGIQELGADYVAMAPINHRKFITTKYTAWVRHAFRGTALDWIVFTAKSSQLPEDFTRFIRSFPVALMHVNHVFNLGFAQRLLRQVQSGGRVPMILETHDVQSHLLEQTKDINPWTHKRDAPQRLLQSELKLLNQARVLVHCSVDDYNFFKVRLPQKQHVLALPTIDESFISAVKAVGFTSVDSIDLLFVGQSTDPNLRAVQWFFEQVWPLIDDRGYNLKIIGAIDLLVRKSLPGIYEAYRSRFVGPVADLVPHYRVARCVIAPMVSGSGISIKTIEALGLGKPFVGTSKAFRGMPMERIKRAGLQTHDTPQAFANAISRTLSNEHLAATASRTAYDDLFSNRAAFSSRDTALEMATRTCSSC